MFGLSRKEKFVREYFEFLTQEVFGLQRTKLLKHYPGVRLAGDKAFLAGSRAKEAATHVTRAILADIIRQVSEGRRQIVLDQYEALNWDAYFAWYLDSRLMGRQPTPEKIDNLTMIIARAQCAIYRSERVGELPKVDLDDFVSDIAGALEGMSQRERTMERLRSAYEAAVGRRIDF